MHTAKLFENGRSQAVRLPKECRFGGNRERNQPNQQEREVL